MTDNVWVPRELLKWVKEQLPNHVALDGETDLYRRAQLSRLLAQSVASEPVAVCNSYDVDWLPGSEILKEGDKLYAYPPAPAIPEGYALVPVEPTPKMIDATWDHPVDKNGGIESQNARNKRIYCAMLAASAEYK